MSFTCEEGNWLFQDGDGLNGAAHALTDAIMGQIQCAYGWLRKSLGAQEVGQTEEKDKNSGKLWHTNQ